MRRVGKVAGWLVTQAVFTGAVWMGTVGGQAGAANVAIFWVWVTFIASLGMLSDDIARKVQRERDRPAALVWLSWAARAFVLVLMVWHAWFATAAACLVAWLLFARVPPPGDDASGEARASHG